MLKGVARVLVTVLSILAVAQAGCARRPGMAGASAPAPSGEVTTMTADGASPTARASGTRGTGSSATPPARAAAVKPVERPAPRDFQANANLQMIHFDFDKSEIRPGDAKILDASARWLTSSPKQLVLIEGHCDERGTSEYNLALGERRAQATKDYLVSRGVQAARVSTISYGEERPRCTAHNESCWSQNRRAQFLTKDGP